MANNNNNINNININRNPLDSKYTYSPTSNNMKFVHWPLMDGLLHLI